MLCSEWDTFLYIFNPLTFYNSYFIPQSGDVQEGAVRTNAPYEKQENLAFTSATPTYMRDVTTSYDKTRTEQDTYDVSLQNFFSRPIKIFETGWGVGTSLYSAIDPWSLYFNNTRVVNRISNYKLLRCKLHIKIVLNGNGFFYGRAIAAYMPLENRNFLNTNRAVIPSDLMQVSQLPHVFLNPTLSAGGELVLPFFYYFNNLDIPAANWVNMGRLYLRSVTNLKHANAASENVTISVFAWAEDVELSGLTSIEPFTLAPQSGEIDEAKSGVISKPASALAKSMGMLSSIPVIGPYAMATEKALNTVAAVSKCFGYARPTVITEPHFSVVKPCANICSTDTPDLAAKLSVDSKQELTIDPKISGLQENTDVLAIKSISQRESYLTKFVWFTSSPGESLIWNTVVSPMLWSETTVDTVTEYHLPPMAVAALPFKYWTGSIRFRFQVVASAFHKGRIKVAYDPNFLLSNEYNVNYIHVFDIAESSDFTVSIANMQDRTLLKHALPGIDPISDQYGNTLFTDEGIGNGRLAVYVVNELTTPNSTVNNDVEVNVYVSTGDDFEVFVPDNHFQNFVFKPQSGAMPDQIDAEELDRPTQTSDIIIGVKPTYNLHSNLVFTGESIVSFREMLHRYTIHQTHGGNFGNLQVGYVMQSMFPFFRGNVGNAIHQTAIGDPYNYCNTLLLHWIVSCFSGWRGSIRWKASYRGNGAYTNRLRTIVERLPQRVTYGRGTTAGVAYSSNSDAAYRVIPGSTSPGSFPSNRYPTCYNGATMLNDLSSNVIEWENPFYSDARFYGYKTADYTNNVNLEGFLLSYYGVMFTSAAYDLFTAIGEDFQVYFWTAMPPLFYEADAPLPDAP